MNIDVKRKEKDGEITTIVSVYENGRLVRKLEGNFPIDVAEEMFEKYGIDVLSELEEEFRVELELMSKI